MSNQKIERILFVCLGNICRSPTAEGVFKEKAAQQGVSVTVDSAGTSGYKDGVAPDKRAQDIAKVHGYDISKLKCRRITDKDFEQFDLIVAMDKENQFDLINKCPEELRSKIVLFMDFCDSQFDEVPDPYYGGKKGFEVVMDLIEKASDGLIAHIKQRGLHR